MSIAYQADIFCDGKEVNSQNADGCPQFIEQAAVIHNSHQALAKRAWKVAQSAGWKRISWPINQRETGFKHLCPRCAAIYEALLAERANA